VGRPVPIASGIQSIWVHDARDRAVAFRSIRRRLNECLRSDPYNSENTRVEKCRFIGRRNLPVRAPLTGTSIVANGFRKEADKPGTRRSVTLPAAPERLRLRLFLGTAVLACKGRFALRPCTLRAPMPAGRLRRWLRGSDATMPNFDFRKSGGGGRRRSRRAMCARPRVSRPAYGQMDLQLWANCGHDGAVRLSREWG
jgi:hypothetical protein